jgi:general secretion pathway protein D
MTVAVLGQAANSTSAPSEDKSVQAADLLRRARQAMGENDFAAAEALIAKAEALDVSYGTFYMGDTPKKVRRDLERKQASASPTKPSQIFSPLGGNKNQSSPKSDPFGGQANSAAVSNGNGSRNNNGSGNASQVTPLPKVESANPNQLPSSQNVASSPVSTQASSPAANSVTNPALLPAGASLVPANPVPSNAMTQSAVPPVRPLASPSAAPLASPLAAGTVNPSANPVANASGNAPAGQANKSPLREARIALAFGDVRRANELTQQARALQVNYQLLDDTPEKVEAAIRKYQDLSSLDKSTEAYRRAFARNMMDQAEGLCGWGVYDEAERLAMRANEQGIVYGPFDSKPSDLLKRLDAMRRSGDRPANPALAAAGQNASASVGSPAGGNLPAPSNVNSAAQQAANPMAAARQNVAELTRQARAAMKAGQLDQAEALAKQADQFQLPNSAFAPGEDRPSVLLFEIRQQRMRGNVSGVVQASGQYPVTAAGGNVSDRNAEPAVYDANRDLTRNVQASSQQNVALLSQRPSTGTQGSGDATQLPQVPPEIIAPPSPATKPMSSATNGMALFEQGEAALKAHDTEHAYQLFQQAAANINDLDAVTAQRLQDHLQLLSVSQGKSQAGQGGAMVDEAVSKQQALYRQVSTELANKVSSARALYATDPKAALALLEDAKAKVENSGLEPSSRDRLIRNVDRAIDETQKFVNENRAQLELTEKNKAVTEEIDRSQMTKVQIKEKIALKIDEFNRLMDQNKFEEAQVVAKQAEALDPKDPVVVQLVWQAKFVSRYRMAKDIEDRAEDGFVRVMREVDEAKIPFPSDKKPMVFPEAKTWDKLTGSRKKFQADNDRHRTEKEIDIEKKLRTQVSVHFTNAPLNKVMEQLGNLTEISIHLDQQGLAEEGLTPDTPVTLELGQDIMLKSALNLILEELHLTYIIKDEVLKITSEQMRDGQLVQHVYSVADLIVPIPNFVPQQAGMASAYTGAMANVGMGGASLPFGTGTASPMQVASRDGKGGSAAINPGLLAQMANSGVSNPASGASRNASLGGTAGGPGGLGGGSQADFDSLIDLITSTIAPDKWDSVGGAGSITQFETNMSIVVRQTQEVHEAIADLLAQLRRLQDLQVTIEVRFITLTDKFFERIGISFDFDIGTNSNGKGVSIVSSSNSSSTTGATTTTTDRGKAITVGMSSPTTFSSDLDIPFTQNSYGLSVPQFGGFDASAGASLGFAILSDIEAYFFINAAQGNRRSNVLQAPKVTLFNGQQASISDTTQTPFVMSVIPVVGDFAAAQQPVIVILSEGTFMTVQAVVSADRRFVRLTVVPFFSNIGSVSTFTFTGSSTTTTDSSREGLKSGATSSSKLWNKTSDSSTTTSTGTTVQLPSFSYVTVTTTVSVPDGGTVLLGGIKRLSEGRNDFGVPGLDKIPYINRLFRNTSIGRETSSLMMMVTPRIIIQEEEEANLGTAPTDQ